MPLLFPEKHPFNPITLLRLCIAANCSKKAVDAINILSFMPSNSSEVLLELIKSAIANAENAQYGTKEELVISTIYADQSTVIKRWRARARGRAGTFNRPQSHIFVELSDNTIGEES